MKGDTDSPQVIALPPLIFLGAIFAGFIIDLIVARPFIPEAYDLPVGWALIALSIALMMWSVRTFGKAGTNVDVRKPSTTVVSDGPYAYSRNPIYLAMAFFTVGAAIWLNSLWIIGALIVVLIVINDGVIVREETYLEKKFGKKYLEYKGKVRRWM